MKENRKNSVSDWKRIDNMKDSEIDYSDLPELDDNFWKNAEWIIPDKKSRLSMRVDSDVLYWFKSMGKGYQTKINAVLKSYMKAAKKTEIQNQGLFTFSP